MFHLCIFPNRKCLFSFIGKKEIFDFKPWIYQSNQRDAILIHWSIAAPVIENICYQAALNGGEHHPIENQEELGREKWINNNQDQLSFIPADYSKSRESQNFDHHLEDGHN